MADHAYLVELAEEMPECWHAMFSNGTKVFLRVYEISVYRTGEKGWALVGKTGRVELQSEMLLTDFLAVLTYLKGKP